MNKPNFFIVGAPKCGTTALYEYLKTHPNIFISRPKEPHFFATDLPGYQYVKDEQAYLELFAQATQDQFMIGEASVYYMYSVVAAKNIRDFNKDAKIIVMLRNPIDLVYSMHSQLLYSRNEDEPDFRVAWSKVNSRKSGKMVPRHCKDVKVLYYHEIGKLGEQLERYLDNFPPKQIKIVFFEDFVRDTATAYYDILKFLGVKNDWRASFPRVNENKTFSLSLIADFTENPPPAFVKLAMYMKKFLGLRYLKVLRKIRNLNTTVRRRERLADDLRAQLLAAYREDIMKLSRLTNRDLSAWTTL